VRELVGVRVEDGIQPKRLHGAPQGCGWVWGRAAITVVSIAEKGIRLMLRTAILDSDRLPACDG